MAWENLKEDLAEEFASFGQRAYEMEDAYERWSSYRRQRAREGRGLEDGRAQRRRKAQRQQKIGLRLAAGCCALCDEKRTPDGSRYCTEHFRQYTAYAVRRRTARMSAGRCTRGCGRPIREVKGWTRGKPPTRCEECAAKTRARGAASRPGLTARKRARVAAGRCIQGCDRPIREVKRWTGGKPPVLCEECAAETRARGAARRAKNHKLLPASPVRAHLLQLRSLGIAWGAMAAVAGVSLPSVRRLIDVTTLRVSARTAERILELEAVLCEEPSLAAVAT